MGASKQSFFNPYSRSNKREPLVQPFVKWVGGKRQLLTPIRSLLPTKIKRYYEPCIGGGAVLLDMQPPLAVVNDFNEELINCYLVIKNSPEELIAACGLHPNTSDHFYEVRGMDRHPKFSLRPKVERAARILYLNKTCFNGLFRVNSQGQFNVPFGSYTNPVIAEPTVIRAVSRYLNNAQIDFRNGDFAAAVWDAGQDDFVYFDPPYDPVSDTSSFTGYSIDGFSRNEQTRLKEVCDELTQRGVKLLLSNSDTPFIRELFSEDIYTVRTVQARRNINSVATGRGKVDEVFVLNYTPEDLAK